jgi:hypothetical protein
MRWVRRFETNDGALITRAERDRLAAGREVIHEFPYAHDLRFETLAELLGRRGMLTVAVVDDGFALVLRRGNGFERGFEHYHVVDTFPDVPQDDAGTADVAIAALGAVPQERRLFMWVHFFGVHTPDQRHADVPDFGGFVVGGYDHEIRYLDQQLARLLSAIQSSKRPVAVFITSDHGEVLAGVRYHGFGLEEDVIRVPLIASVPGWPARAVQPAVTLVDLLPTILTLTETPLPQSDGIDLSPLVRDGIVPPKRVLLSDTWRHAMNERDRIDYTAAFDGHRKVVFERLSFSLASYDQDRPRAPPRAARFDLRDPLVASMLNYLEDTGGALSFAD